jgi:hypothetical protein
VRWLFSLDDAVSRRLLVLESEAANMGHYDLTLVSLLRYLESLHSLLSQRPLIFGHHEAC